ncbi:DUF1810 domain-containing protein [Caulobacter sp. KR2-114]|uniref:DUF1810 domain-containing protein n=1 Tax=Caulobacter sp. KR2-114 TaxID=3400912 RepID=UPI003C049CAD
MPTPEDPFDLIRFEEAQDDVLDQVRAELAEGRKRGHWIWYVFPQFAGLGASIMSQGYAIRSRAEAQAFMAHPVLGPRLKQLVALATQIPERSATQVFGTPDDLKFRSCVTLFGAIEPDEPVFQRALARFYGGQPDPKTLELLAASG